MGQRRTTQQFIDQMAQLNPSISVLGEYTNSKSHIKVKCEHCGYEWKVTPSNLLKGRGCPECSKSATSFLEQVIYIAFCQCLGNDKVISRDTDTIGKELDVYIPSLRLAFEPGSWYFHSSRIDNDFAKLSLCQSVGIDLKIIYTEYKSDLPCPIDSAVCLSGKYGPSERNEVMKLVSSLLTEQDLELNSESWNFVLAKAAERSRFRTTKEFVDTMRVVNPNIEIIGEYTSAMRGIRTRCSVCGYEWNPSPHHLLEGHGCKRCGKVLLKSDAEFRKEIASKMPGIELVGKYKNAKTRIDVECKICGHKWSADPSNLQAGHGCPICKGGIKYTQADFESRLRKVHPSIETLSQYINSVTPIKFHCLKCGNEWEAKPTNLLQNNGCPKCSGRTRRTPEQFEKEISRLHPNIEVIGRFTARNKPVQVKCRTCGREWSPLAGNLLAGHGCPVCSRRKRIR